jgi:hypothetical protein
LQKKANLWLLRRTSEDEASSVQAKPAISGSTVISKVPSKDIESRFEVLVDKKRPTAEPDNVGLCPNAQL